MSQVPVIADLAAMSAWAVWQVIQRNALLGWSLLFLLTAGTAVFQGVSLWGGKPIPVQFIQILPYLVTILVLAGFVGRSRAPKALGTAFRRA